MHVAFKKYCKLAGLFTGLVMSGGLTGTEAEQQVNSIWDLYATRPAIPYAWIPNMIFDFVLKMLGLGQGAEAIVVAILLTWKWILVGLILLIVFTSCCSISAYMWLSKHK